MPTHRKEGKESMDMTRILDLNKLNNLLKVNNTVLLIKKHYYHRHEPQIDNKVYSNVIEITNEQPNAQELLDAADILITDYSSVMYDFANTGRKIKLFVYDSQEYEGARGMYENVEEYTFAKVKTVQELSRELQMPGGEADASFLETIKTLKKGQQV